jgi:hypothetical protein
MVGGCGKHKRWLGVISRFVKYLVGVVRGFHFGIIFGMMQDKGLK